jgi:hypothetical protein
MAESTIPKPESATRPQHPVDESKIFEIFGNVSDCVGKLVGRRSLQPPAAND